MQRHQYTHHGMNGRQALAVGPKGLQAPLDFAGGQKGGPFTVACWIKTRSNPFMGGLVNVDGLAGASLKQGGLQISVTRALSDSWSSSMLSSWTHLAFTCDGKQVCAYRNGVLLSSGPLPENARYGWGKKFSLGGMAYNDDPAVVVQSIHFYGAALAPEAVENLYLWGKYGPAQAVAR